MIRSIDFSLILVFSFQANSNNSVIIFVLKLVTWLIIFQDFSLQFKSESYLATSGQSDINQLTVILPAILGQAIVGDGGRIFR